MRGDFAMSALLSAIPNTGHYRARPRRALLIAALRSICKQWTRPTGSSVPASIKLTTHAVPVVAKELSSQTATNMHRTCSRDSWSVFVLSHLGEGSGGIGED